MRLYACFSKRLGRQLTVVSKEFTHRLSLILTLHSALVAVKPGAVAFHFIFLLQEIDKLMKRVITFGTFDVFHVGHINILERAASHGDYLIVGISSDELNFSKKNRFPIYSQEDRIKIISSMKFVDEVFVEESLEMKLDYIKMYNANVLVMGDDWSGKFDWVKPACEVIYLPRTPSISTTEIIEVVKMTR